MIHAIFRGEKRIPNNVVMDTLWASVLNEIEHGTFWVDCKYDGGDYGFDYTLLHQACLFCNVDVVRALLAAGANPSMKNSEGSTPMHFVAISKMPATLATRIAICRMLPQEDLASQDKFGDTPLMSMARWGAQVNVFQWVLQHPSCDINSDGQKVLNIVMAQSRYDNKQVFADMLVAEMAARKRWGYARAAWCVACTACL